MLPVSISKPALKAEPPNGGPGAGKGCDSPKQTQVMSGSRARGAPWECCLAPETGMGLSCRILFPPLLNLPLPHPTSCSLWPPARGPAQLSCQTPALITGRLPQFSLNTPTVHVFTRVKKKQKHLLFTEGDLDTVIPLFYKVGYRNSDK